MAKKERKAREKIDWTVTPWGVFLRSGWRTLGAFETDAKAVEFIKGLPVKKQSNAVVAFMKPVKVQTSVSL